MTLLNESKNGVFRLVIPVRVAKGLEWEDRDIMDFEIVDRETLIVRNRR